MIKAQRHKAGNYYEKHFEFFFHFMPMCLSAYVPSHKGHSFIRIIRVLLFMITLLSSTLEAFNFNMDFETDLLYTRYRKNAFFLMNNMSNQLSPVSSFEEIRLKLEKEVEPIHFNINTRFYIRPQTSSVDYVIDNAYFSIMQGPFITYVGKQRIKWGVGYAWNPSDLLQPTKDIFDPTRYLEGIYAVRMEYSNDFITPSIIISPEPQNNDDHLSRNIKLACQLYKLVGTADVFLNSIYLDNQFLTLGGAVSWDMGICVLNLEGAGIQYKNKNLNILRALDQEDSKKIKFNYLAGLAKSMGSEFFLTLEYYRNEWGLTNPQFNQLWNTMIQNPENVHFIFYGMKKDYMSFDLSYTWQETMTFDIATLLGLNDNSLVVYPRITYLVNSNFDVTLGVFENLSKQQNGEGYEVIPIIDSVELRIKAYF